MKRFTVPIRSKMCVFPLAFAIFTIFHSVFFAFGLVFSPVAVAHTAPAAADSMHFYLPFDYEQWRRDHPRPAAKRLANLNVGEPRTVRMIYFLPNDRPYRAEVVQRMKDEIRQVQTFYAEQMQAHGYGNKTFRFETDAQGEPVVHRVDGQHPNSHYLDETLDTVLGEIDQAFDISANIYLTVIDNSSDLIGSISQGRTGTGIAGRINKNAGFALVTGGFSLRTATHELGHASGLYHDFQDQAYIMSYGGLELSRSQLSACHAEFLSVHPYFNFDSPLEEAPSPTIRLISSPAYPSDSKRVSVQLELSDTEGLHQVILLNTSDADYEVWECRGLAGERETVVEFDYDGYSAFAADWGRILRLSDKAQHQIKILVVDTDGNVGEVSFVLEVDDPSELPRVPIIVKISGIDQQGPPGERLAYPFIVEVRDQDDKPLPDTQVTFAVITGHGKLSERFTIEQTMTDVNGRAQSILTLGQDSGANIVNVSAPRLRGCEPVFFKAIGARAPTLSTVEGDYRTWHLPDGATIRLGKGLIGVPGDASGSSDRAVAFSPDGQRLAVASGIGLWLYDVATSRELALLPTERQAHSAAFSRDGTMLASGLDDGTITLWDASTLAYVATLSGSRYGGVTSVSFSHDGAMLASGTYSGTVSLWDLATRANIATYNDVYEGGSRGWTRRSTSVSFSHNGIMLAFGSRDGTAQIWDVATGTQIATLSGHRLRVASVSFSPDGTLLASGSNDGTVKLWDVATWTNIATLEGHTSGITAVSFSPDGTTLASGSSDYTVKLWDVATRKNIATFEGHINGVASVSFSPDGMMLLSGSVDGTARVWDIQTGNAAAFYGHGHLGNSVSFSPDGTILASGSEDETVKLWDVETGRNIDSFGLHKWGVAVVSFSPDGKTLASGSSNNTIKLWDVASGANKATLFRGRGQILSMAFSPDGTTLAVGDPAGLVLWDVTGPYIFNARCRLCPTDIASGPQVATPLGHTDWVWSVAFSPDGKLVASGSSDGTFTLWDAPTLAHISTFDVHMGWVKSVSFSPDGTLLASGATGDGTVKLWDIATRKNIATLEGYTSHVYAVSFSPDGDMLAYGLYGGMVKLWDVATRENIATFEGHTGNVQSLSFSPDGTMLASGSEDGTILLWDMEKLTQSQPQTLVKISGDKQEGAPSALLANPLVVEVKDQNGNVLEGVAVTFVVTAGGGMISASTDTTDANGRAQTTLTLGSDVGANTVEVSVAGIDQPVTFTVKAVATPDFNGDEAVDFSDFLLFTAQFGFSQEDEGYQARFDLDGDGTIGFGDFLIFANSFGTAGS